MAHVPLRMAQPGLMAPHQQQPPLMVSMTQPPPVSMQGMVSVAPVIGHGGGMAVMTQAMNHPEASHDPHSMNGPYNPHHLHHTQQNTSPRPHVSSQNHHPVLPPHHSGPPPSHSQYHHHPSSGAHHVQHNRHNSLHHSSYNINSHSTLSNHSGPHPQSHISSHSGANNMNTHTNHGPNQNQMQPDQGHMSQQSHSISYSHQISTVNSGIIHRNPPQMHHSHVPQSPALSQSSQSGNHSRHQGSHSQGNRVILSNEEGTPRKEVSQTSDKTSVISSNSGTLLNDDSNGDEKAEISSSSEISIKSSLSTREKTPMCLINELARYNKVSHQYCLTDEQGPAHKKNFTVTLKLGNKGEEQYSASGASIKKAQHMAAALSLEKTKLKHPPPKTQKQDRGGAKLTPTVELNALAMKRGEPAKYTFLEGPRHPSNAYAYNTPPNFRNMYNQPRFYGRTTVYPMFLINLRVGNREFSGEGATAQQAKHNAASKALRALKFLPMPSISGTSSGTRIGGNEVSSDEMNKTNSNERKEEGGRDQFEGDANSDVKSSISLVHEIALKRNLTVSFEVVRESGPPHMRIFVTSCTVGDIRVQGEGPGKKISKKCAAQAMYEELRKLPSVLSSSTTRVKHKTVPKKKGRNLIKEQKASPEYGQNVNPITRLIQIQQAKKEKEPQYKLFAERGAPRRREFVMQVTIGIQSAQGTGPNKKLAKRAAAESMLQLLGYSQQQPLPTRPALKTNGSNSEAGKNRKVTFVEDSESTYISMSDPTQPSGVQTNSIPAGSGRQLVPGLIMMQDTAGLHGYNQMQHSNNFSSINLQTTAVIAKELLESGTSPTANSMNKNDVQPNNRQMQTNSISNQASLGSQHHSVNNIALNSNANNGNQQQIQTHMNHHSIIQSNTSSTVVHSSQQQTAMPQHNQLDVSDGNPAPSAVHLKNQNNKIGANSVTENGIHGNNSNGSRSGGSLTISGNTNGQAIGPKDQLMYLASILNLQVQFIDFPKGNKSEYLSLVSLSTSPPHVSHGSGTTVEASHDQACLTALRALAEIGLDSVTPSNA